MDKVVRPGNKKMVAGSSLEPADRWEVKARERPRDLGMEWYKNLKARVRSS
ncbi:hypothetical protein PHLCEN_2v6659 [Hermanssonia centrifuga]|uniref:Uncharacterized protein n=1 Tax=Hermanssonia centrifuga TaxID=98765 RepID=A0A2R6NYY5_9APHY|nr:hypothetical protein PHLCEN_2v6659 [Hermanssonia centrifuga]